MSIEVAGYGFGLAAGAFWLASAAASFWALRARLDLGAGSESSGAELLMVSGEDGSGSVVINGIVIPTFAALATYQRSVTTRNGLAAGLNSLAAICACIAAYFAFISSTPPHPSPPPCVAPAPTSKEQ